MRREFDNNTVSVITPVYNAEKFITDTLDSALAQTYEDMEIVLVDDCSKDRSAEIINAYRAKYDNIVYHKQDENGGAAVARNTALEIASGRYVAFLDSDDIWKPEKTVEQLKLMKEKNAAICFTAIEMIDETGTLIKNKRKIKEKLNYKFLLKNTMIATSSVIIDRAQTGDFRMPLRRSGQDYATWLLLMRNGTEAYGINQALVSYRVSSGSLSSNKMKSVRQVWQIQTRDEGIGKLSAMLNVCCFCFNALKKHFF